LKDLNGIKTPKLVCRGTAMRRTATEGFNSAINDILLEIGTMGIKQLWPELSKYLQTNRISSIEILGKSLGGAQAQELAILMEGVDLIEVKKLTTFCSVGVGEDINSLFKKMILQNRKSPFEMQVIRNAGRTQSEVDYVPVVGGVHLGEKVPLEKCHIEVCYIHPGREGAIIYPKNPGLLNLIRNFMGSFGNAHCRQTTLNEFSWHTIQGRDHIDEHLRFGSQLERIRKGCAYAINCLTGFWLNGKSFTSFVEAQKQSKTISLPLPAYSYSMGSFKPILN
jgi:hypothetical protein